MDKKKSLNDSVLQMYIINTDLVSIAERWTASDNVSTQIKTEKFLSWHFIIYRKSNLAREAIN